MILGCVQKDGCAEPWDVGYGMCDVGYGMCMVTAWLCILTSEPITTAWRRR